MCRRRPLTRSLTAASVAAIGVLAIAGLVAGTAGAATLPTVTIAASPSAVTVGGSLESGGVNVVTSTTGLKEASIIVVALKPGVSAAELFSAVHEKAVKDPNNAGKYGSIVLDVEGAAGQKNETQTTFTAGAYAVLVKEGEGPPKATGQFTVASAKAPATLPMPQAIERTIEFGFRGPSTLKVGELVRFENEGFLVHMDFAIPTKSHKTAQALVKDLLAGKEKQAEKLIAGPPAGFAGPLSPGAYQQETISARPGWYVQVCFMDTQDGRSHTLLGMERIIKITA